MADDFAEFVARLTDNARTSLQHANSIARGQHANSIARGYGSAYIGTEHMLLGLLAQGSSVGAKVLADANVTLERAELALQLTPRNFTVSTGMVGLSETAKLTLKMGWEIAQEFHQDHLGTEHILYSILSQKNARATTLLKDMNVDIDALRADLEEFFDRQHNAFHEEQDVATTEKRKKRGGALETYGTDLTARARSGKLDPVIGRDAQQERLATRSKNDLLLYLRDVQRITQCL